MPTFKVWDEEYEDETEAREIESDNEGFAACSGAHDIAEAEADANFDRIVSVLDEANRLHKVHVCVVYRATDIEKDQGCFEQRFTQDGQPLPLTYKQLFKPGELDKLEDQNPELCGFRQLLELLAQGRCPDIVHVRAAAKCYRAMAAALLRGAVLQDPEEGT